MPAMPPAAGVTRAVLNYTSNGIATANVLHFVAAPGPDAPDPTALGSRLALWWKGQMKPIVSATQTLNNVTCTDLSAGGPPAVVYSTGLPDTGTNGSQPIPNNCALVMSLVTGLRGRSYRGRIYVGGLTESQTNGNAVDTGTRDLIVAKFDMLITFTAALEPDYNLVVLSYFADGSIRTTPVATLVTTVRADTRVDTQRRRMS